jgi:hypothetical protein
MVSVLIAWCVGSVVAAPVIGRAIRAGRKAGGPRVVG